MHKHVQTLFRLGLWGILITLISCQKGGNRLNAQKPQDAAKPIIIEEELIPTFSYSDSDEPIVKNGVTYQAPPKKLKNKNAELLIGRVKMDKTKIIYDQGTRQLKVMGSARILDENRTEIGATDFEISGSHEADENRIFLKDPKKLKANSSETPLVRAKVTCLDLNEKDEFGCSRAVVDFFIAYKKQIFTEQMELVQKAKPSAVPAVPATPSPEDDPADDLQSEGIEESIEGRYQGHAETADLKVVFEGDEDDPVPQVVIGPDLSVISPEPNPTPIVIPPTTMPPATVTTTPGKGTSTPSKPPVVVQPPKTPQASTSTPPTATEPQNKSEKKLNKDWLQLRNGDVRQFNQAIGLPNKGALRNASSLLTKQQALNQNAHFEVVNPARNSHFGTHEMIEIITRIGKELSENFRKKVFVSSISKKSGGSFSPHASHQAGIDVDVAYPSTSDEVKFPVVVQMRNRQYNPSSYSVEKTFALLKYTFSQPDIRVDRIFMDRTIKKSLCDYAKSKNEFSGSDKTLVNTIFNSIDHVDGHGDHFHIRLRCSPYDPECRNKTYVVNKGCS